MQDIRFIIFEKSALIRLGLITLLRETEHIIVAGDYRNTDDFEKNIENTKPDFVVISNKLLNKTILESIKKSKNNNNTQYILLAHEDEPKTNSFWIDEIPVNEEKIFIEDKLEKLINQQQKNKHKEKDNKEISKRERAVLAMVAQGYTNKEIAEKLFISTHTVITHRKNIVKKLGIKTVSGLTVYAILNKIIDMNDLK